MTLLQTIGQQIRALRKSAGLNQSGLANRLGVTREYISMIETGKQPISIEQLQKIAGVLGAKVDINMSALVAANAIKEFSEAANRIEEFKKGGNPKK